MIYDIVKKLRPFAWLLPGFLLWAAFPPMGEKIDVIFALAPLIWLSRQGEPKVSRNRWLLSGMFFWVATLSWMPAIVKNGGPWPLVVLGWGALAAYCTLYFGAYGYWSAAYWQWTRQQANEQRWRLVGVLVVEPVLWCGLELVRSRFLGGFAWNQLGVVAVNGGFGAPAAIGGVYLCSAVIFYINGSIAGIAERFIASMRRQRVNHWRSLETLLAFIMVWGIYQLPSALVKPREETSGLKVAMVQRNFPCCFKQNEENPYETYDRLLTNVKAFAPELVVLSESAMCDFGLVDRSGAQGFADWVAKNTGARLLAGGTRKAEGRTYNSAALYATNAECQVYDKVHLVPFGEFIPLDKMFPILQKLAPVGSCTPGEMRVLEFDGTKIGVAICYEDTDSALMRKAAKMGADILCFITNDSWFSESDEAVAHAWQATARAVETGLPVVRVGNSGVTGTITPKGKASWLTGIDGKPLVDKAATMFDRVAFQAGEKPPTPYVRVGDIPLATIFLLLMMAIFLVYYKHYYEKRRYLSL